MVHLELYTYTLPQTRSMCFFVNPVWVCLKVGHAKIQWLSWLSSCSWFLFHSKAFFGAYPFSPMFCPRWRTSRSRSGCCSPRQYSSAAAANFLGDGVHGDMEGMEVSYFSELTQSPHEWRNDGMTKTRSWEGMEGMEVSYFSSKIWWVVHPSSKHENQWYQLRSLSSTPSAQ